MLNIQHPTSNFHTTPHRWQPGHAKKLRTLQKAVSLYHFHSDNPFSPSSQNFALPYSSQIIVANYHPVRTALFRYHGQQTGENLGLSSSTQACGRYHPQPRIRILQSAPGRAETQCPPALSIFSIRSLYDFFLNNPRYAWNPIAQTLATENKIKG